ncbi:hypothetical protein BDV12DRAFT_173865, partial [Aspergillus spectabilis]
MDPSRPALQELPQNNILATITNPAPKPPALSAFCTPNASTKRKAPTPDPFADVTSSRDIDDIEDDDPRLEITRWDCGQIRSKINLFIKSGEMKVGEFQRALGVSSRAYTTFMKQTGRMKGEFSDTYSSAHRFFLKREILGIRNKRTPGTTKKTKIDNETKYDVSEITLEGEDTMSVEIYDTCDVIRKKIRTFLKESGMTQAAFCREISKTFPSDMGKCLQGRSLTSFLAKSGPDKGNSSEVFYAAYVFF